LCDILLVVAHCSANHPYVQAIQELGYLTNLRITTPYLIPDFIFWRSKPGKSFQRAADVVHQHAEKVSDVQHSHFQYILPIPFLKCKGKAILADNENSWFLKISLVVALLFLTQQSTFSITTLR